jgi:hypothetical protein
LVVTKEVVVVEWVVEVDVGGAVELELGEVEPPDVAGAKPN